MESRERPRSETDAWPVLAHPTTKRIFEGYDDVLSVLSDDASRSLLCATDEPSTAKELSGECDLPLSTVYRKLEYLASTPLIEETTRPRLHGKHPQQYHRTFQTLVVRVPAHRCVDVSLVPRSVDVSLVPRPGDVPR